MPVNILFIGDIVGKPGRQAVSRELHRLVDETLPGQPTFHFAYEGHGAESRCVRTWGKACYVGEGDNVTLDVSPDLLRRQVTIVGSWTFSTVGQADCARFVADRKVPLGRLLTHRWRLDQALPDADLRATLVKQLRTKKILAG